MNLLRIASYAAFLAFTTMAASQTADLPPTPLEAFAIRPTAMIVQSVTVGEEASIDRVLAGLARGNAEESLIFSFNAAGNRGLIIGGYEFVNYQPQDLAALLQRAAAELKASPR